MSIRIINCVLDLYFKGISIVYVYYAISIENFYL